MLIAGALGVAAPPALAADPVQLTVQTSAISFSPNGDDQEDTVAAPTQYHVAGPTSWRCAT
jgi:hypothetical protein